MGQTSSAPETLLTEGQAAEMASLSVRTLQAWRLKDFGPPYVKFGKAVRYRRIDLADWIAANIVTPARAVS